MIYGWWDKCKEKRTSTKIFGFVIALGKGVWNSIILSSKIASFWKRQMNPSDFFGGLHLVYYPQEKSTDAAAYFEIK